MGIRKFVYMAVWFLSTGLLYPCFAQSTITLEQRIWPESKKCDGCVPIQFGRLNMLLPINLIGRILVINSEASALHFLTKTTEPYKDVLFMTRDFEKITGKYKKSGFLQYANTSTPEQFFDSLGKPAEKDNKPLFMMRQIEQIENAVSYTKASKNDIHVYWMRSPAESDQQIYFVLDGEQRVYSLFGNVTPELYDAILSHLQNTEIP